jgi:putative membrane-bound dehydrogenase-like protein
MRMLIIWTLLIASLCGAPETVRSPLSPDASLKQFRLPADLKIELVAAEPEVIDPISIAFDENGTLWAVEMTDYPNGPKPGQPPLSRISALKDLDGDGRYEASQVFVDQLLFATGIQPWKGGVIVTLAGEVAWFQDTDGDGKADLKQTWFRGFAEQNPQLRANHPRLGLDNRIYVANGLRGGTITSDSKTWGVDRAALPLTGFDFRFDPRTGVAETVSGVGQFGLTFDDYGRRFVCSNRNPCRQIVLEDHYLKRNPLLAVSDVGLDVTLSGADSRIYPISRAWTTSTTHAGQFTAACGVTIYRGSGLPSKYLGNSFTCDPTGNLVHRDTLKMQGVHYVAEPSTSTEEFLASTDEWFRPVDLANGPDGALYVVDMYRAVIEHPEWVPDELKKRPDERDGSDRGRIYRITARTDAATQESRAPQSVTSIDKSNTAGLIARLAHPDSWQRDTVARLLFESHQKSDIPVLMEVAKYSKSPLGRIHAYWLLQGLDIETSVLAEALSDPSPRVREQGLILVEGTLKKHPDVLERVVKLADDEDARVRFQAALCLGDVELTPAVAGALATIYLKDSQDEWTRRAVLSSVGQNPVALLMALAPKFTEAGQPAPKQIAAGLQDLLHLIGASHDAKSLPDIFANVLAKTEDQTLQTALALGLCRGIQSRNRQNPVMFLQQAVADPKLLQPIQSAFQGALLRATDSTQKVDARLAALSLVEFMNWATAGPSLMKLATVESSQELRGRAIDILANFEASEIEPQLLASYAGQTPMVRRAILRLLLRSPARIQKLFAAISDKQIALVELDPGQVRQLTTYPDAEIKKQAQLLLAALVPQDRREVLQKYQVALKREAAPERGRLIFEKNCATCHQIGKLGVVVGPDIADSRTKTPEQLLTDILNPNQAIDNNYVSYTIATKDGKQETGFIAAETASSITLKQPENKTLQILRQDIEELKSNGVSLMPEGLEKNISIEQMADLISFIKNWRYLDGQVPIKVGVP